MIYITKAVIPLELPLTNLIFSLSSRKMNKDKKKAADSKETTALMQY